MLPILHGEFTVVADPELKFSQAGGKPYARIRLVANDRRFNKDTNQWEDGDPCWMQGTAFGKVAENIAESVTKGSRVLVHGKVKTEEWEKDGIKRSATALMIDSFGVALTFDPAKSYKMNESRGGSQSSGSPWDGPDEPPF